MESLQDHLKMSSINSSNVESFLNRQNAVDTHDAGNADVETDEDEEIDIEDVDSSKCPTKMTDKFSIDSLLRQKSDESSAASNFLNNNKNFALSAISALMVR